jgi:hypothetical protein
MFSPPTHYRPFSGDDPGVEAVALAPPSRFAMYPLASLETVGLCDCPPFLTRGPHAGVAYGIR